MKKIIVSLSIWMSCCVFTFGQKPVVDVSPDKYVFQTKSLGNQLQTVYNTQKQLVESAKIVKTAKETYAVTQSMYNDVNKLYQMQQKIERDVRKFSAIISMSKEDLDCIFNRLGDMLKMGLPGNYKGDLNGMMNFSCNSNAAFLYNLLNPYNSYARANSGKYSVFNVNNVKDPTNYMKNFKNAIGESNKANLALRDMEKKNKVELAAAYTKMSEDESNKARQIYEEINRKDPDRKPEVEFQMMQQADTYMRQAMEHKKESLMLLSSVQEDKSSIEKAEERKQNSNAIRKQASLVQPLVFGK
jgi:hypothetical protein